MGVFYKYGYTEITTFRDPWFTVTILITEEKYWYLSVILMKYASSIPFSNNIGYRIEYLSRWWTETREKKSSVEMTFHSSTRMILSTSKLTYLSVDAHFNYYEKAIFPLVILIFQTRKGQVVSRLCLHDIDPDRSIFENPK